MSEDSVLPKVREMQRRHGKQLSMPRPADRVAFVFSTKDRVDFSLRSLASIDTEPGFDIVWIDGSETAAGKALPARYPFRHATLKEVHVGVGGGPSAAIIFGLRRLFELGYDFCGLIENDVVLQPQWFSTLRGLFARTATDGLAVGAATVNHSDNQVMEYRAGYSINWGVGAATVLLSRAATRLILNEYPWGQTVRKIHRFFGETLGIDICSHWDLYGGHLDGKASPDNCFSLVLYRHGLATIGSVPALAVNLDFDPASVHTTWVTADRDGSGGTCAPMRSSTLWRLRMTDPLFALVWQITGRRPGLYRLARRIDRIWPTPAVRSGSPGRRRLMKAASGRRL